MPKDIYDIILDPTRVRIIQTLLLGARETITAGEVCSLLSDVPWTTLYRHINILMYANILHVVAERKVRGSVERTLSLNASELEQLRHVDDVPGQVFRFLMLIYAKFERYFSKKEDKGHTSATEFMSYKNTVMMLNDEEFAAFFSELQGVFEKYQFHDASNGRKPRDISMIFAPTESE